MEAPDECGHQGDVWGKVKAIEKVDYVVGEMVKYLETQGDFTMVITPDHATPIVKKTHTAEPIPYMIYKSAKPNNGVLKYNETDAQSGEYLSSGQLIITKMLETK